MKRDDEEDESKKDSFEDEPEEHEESSDELELEMETGEKEEDVYSEEGREKLVEDDEIDSWEAGFSEGEEGEDAVCDNCKKVLGKNPVEKRINEKMHKFCSDKCVAEFEARH